MRCYCCESEVDQACHAKLRGDVSSPEGKFKSPDDPAYGAYVKNATFRSAFICSNCYEILDNDYGFGEIGGRMYGLAGASRGGKAALYNEKKYQAFQKRKAAELGIDAI